LTNYGGIFINCNFEEIIVPSIWEEKTFTDKLGEDKEVQMWTFKDKGRRDCCLIPEVTAIIQEKYNTQWNRSMKKPVRLFYVSRCYRYEKPQLGRYREFTQFGVEILGNKNIEEEKKEILSILEGCLSLFDFNWIINTKVTRGIDYYNGFGFEAECPDLGAQKQIAGGGQYPEGMGFAIGVDRLILSIPQ
jgi:histidyl-tRNA synthetase